MENTPSPTPKDTNMMQNPIVRWIGTILATAIIGIVSYYNLIPQLPPPLLQTPQKFIAKGTVRYETDRTEASEVRVKIGRIEKITDTNGNIEIPVTLTKGGSLEIYINETQPHTKDTSEYRIEGNNIFFELLIKKNEKKPEPKPIPQPKAQTQTIEIENADKSITIKFDKKAIPIIDGKITLPLLSNEQKELHISRNGTEIQVPLIDKKTIEITIKKEE